MTDTNYERNIIKQAFKEKTVLLYVMETVQNEDIFTDPICKTLWKVFISVYKEGFNIHHSTISDIIRFSGDTSLQEEFDKIISLEYQNEQEWKYHLYVLLENYKKSLLNSISDTIRNTLDNSSSDEILNEISLKIIELQTSEIRTITFGNACMATIEEIQDINEGRKISFLKTGNPKFDELVSISASKFILVPSLAKIGKSRWVVDLADRLISQNENVNIQWWTFEMKPVELIKCFIGRKLRMDNYELSGKKGKLSEETISKLTEITRFFGKYPIEFINESTDIHTIQAKFVKFCKEHPGESNILIIDNLAYIKPHLKDQTQFEDDVARCLVDLRDKTNGTIILLHHLTKETDNKWNKESGYEPRLSYIRGSKRLVDCPNQIILLHRPDFFEDLVSEAKAMNRLSDIKGLFLVMLEINRDGKTGIITMKHLIEYSYFYEE